MKVIFSLHPPRGTLSPLKRLVYILSLSLSPPYMCYGLVLASLDINIPQVYIHRPVGLEYPTGEQEG